VPLDLCRHPSWARHGLLFKASAIRAKMRRAVSSIVAVGIIPSLDSRSQCIPTSGICAKDYSRLLIWRLDVNYSLGCLASQARLGDSCDSEPR